MDDAVESYCGIGRGVSMEFLRSVTGNTPHAVWQSIYRLLMAEKIRQVGTREKPLYVRTVAVAERDNQ